VAMSSVLRILAVMLLTCAFAGAETIREALVNLCDPAKIATITAEREANPRVRKICYWLEMARQDGRDPSNEMREVMVAVGWGGSGKGDLTSDAMIRNRVIAERLGCLDEAGCPVPTEEALLKMNIKGLSEILLECLRERAGLILNAVNRKAVDSTAAAKASRELLRLSNKIRSVLNNAIGNFDTDESEEEIRSSRSTEELAAQAYMRFFTAAVVLKIHSKDDLADEIDRQIEEITGEKKTNFS